MAFSGFSVPIARRREIARDAAHAGAIRPVRRQLHLEHGIVEAGRIDVAGADLLGHLGRQLDDAFGVADSSSSAAEHIMPFETTPRTGFFSSVILEPGM